MKTNLNSPIWNDAKEMIRRCHLSLLQPEQADVKEWKAAFDTLISAIKEERKTNSDFACELSMLTEDSGFDYDFEGILEEYFDFLEGKDEWELIVSSCDEITSNFNWKKALPSQYMFRKGNALERLGKNEKAASFGKSWLEQYPEDYYAAASNAFLLIALGKIDEALELTEQYLRKELVCDRATDTFFMAANRLYEITDDPYAKERVAKKIAEYDALKSLVEENE